MARGLPQARPPGAHPLVFTDDLTRLELAADDEHHLRRVLRVRDGDTVTVADGAGRWRVARVAAALDAAGEVHEEPEMSPPITIAFALVKGERPELVVQKLTELGADRIVPFVAARSVVRWDDDKAQRNVTRLRRVAREAAMQCRRARLPQVDALVDARVVLSSPGIAIAERDGASPSLAHTAIAIGPEGGWSDEERALATARVGLADHVLRAETAAITACALLAALRSGALASTEG